MRESFSPSEVLLLGPGPSPVPWSVLAASSAPPLGHLDPEFLTLMERVQDDLRALFGAPSAFALPISGTGSGGMEAAVCNLVEPGDRIVVGVHGVFGQRLVEAARRQGAEVVTVEAPFGAALDEAAVAEATRAGPTRLVAFVHAETSTGVLQPFAGIVEAARACGALVLADCVTSFAGVRLDLEERGVDAAFAGTQKCLSVPPGLAPLMLSERAMQRVHARAAPPPSWYFDVALLSAYWREGRERAYHHTAPVQMVYALAAGLELACSEGLEARAARHRDAAAALWRALEPLRLHCLVEAPVRAPMLTSVRVPDGVDEAAVRRHLRLAHAIEIGGGLGPLKGSIWRIGLMGHGARRESVRRVVAALGDALRIAGHPADAGAALRAVDQ